MSTTLEAAKEIVIAFIEKYPMSTSAYSSNIEQTMLKLRADVVEFTKEIYTALDQLERGSAAPQPAPVQIVQTAPAAPQPAAPNPNSAGNGPGNEPENGPGNEPENEPKT